MFKKKPVSVRRYLVRMELELLYWSIQYRPTRRSPYNASINYREPGKSFGEGAEQTFSGEFDTEKEALDFVHTTLEDNNKEDFKELTKGRDGKGDR